MKSNTHFVVGKRTRTGKVSRWFKAFNDTVNPGILFTSRPAWAAAIEHKEDAERLISKLPGSGWAVFRIDTHAHHFVNPVW